MSTMKLRPITQDEWIQYEWVEVTTPTDKHPVFLPGIQIVVPLNDGFVYVERTRFGDNKQRWERAMTPSS